MPQERLQKILSRAGVCSRRKAEELIEAKLVTINGRTAVLGDKADPAEDSIKVDGKRVAKPVPNRYLLLHKPEGHMSTLSDPEGRPTVLDLIPPRLRKALVTVGRLDYNTEGLLLLTTDGEFAQHVAHPRYGCKKTYEVKVKGMPDDSEVARLREGMWIDGKRTEPADVSFLRRTKARGDANNTWWRVTLGEGRTRQIREMFFRVGHPVQRLRRIAIGTLEDRVLEKGSWRDLTAAEVSALMQPNTEPTLGGKKGKPKRPGSKSSAATESPASPPRFRQGERKLRQVASEAGERRRAKKRPRRSGVDSSKPSARSASTEDSKPPRRAGSTTGPGKGRPRKPGAKKPGGGRSGSSRSTGASQKPKRR